MRYSDLILEVGKNYSFELPKYLKWSDDLVGVMNDDHSLTILNPRLNGTVELITEGKEYWSPQEYKSFLDERLPSKSRRDIEKIIQRSGLVEYDTLRLAGKTRAFNARDLFWLSYSEEELFNETMPEVFKEIFIRSKDLEGESVNSSPEGVNIKRYAVDKGYYGILKKRLHPFSTDVESEVAVYELCKKIGVHCCPAWLVDDGNEVMSFSKFEYNFSNEFIVHVRRILREGDLSDSLYRSLVSKLPAFQDEIRKMIILDFITRQVDRHLSNMALKVTGDLVSFYSLYDNGRSLFHEDKLEFMEKAINNIELYSSEFGLVGTYYDAVVGISKEVDIQSLVNLEISKEEILEAYRIGGITGDRLTYSAEWTYRCLEILNRL